MHSDELSVEGLRLRCQLGTKQWEKMTQQDVVVSFSVFADLSVPARSDQLTDTINMGSLVTKVRQYVETASHQLIESLSLEIARILLTEFPIEEVLVNVRKPGAFTDAECEAVTIRREKAFFVQ